jgi:site-specific recombinase XerC
MGVQTLGDYRFENKIAGSKNRIKELVTPDVFQVLEKYEKVMIMSSLSDASKAKNFDTILGLTRMLPSDKNWLELVKDDIENLVVSIMKKHSENGKETSVTGDFKRFLKIWFRFIKFQSRSFKIVGDPLETRDIVTKTVESKITRLQLITPQEKKRLLDACQTLRDKALIDVHYDAGTRIGEILSLQIKHVQKVPNVKAYELSVDGKTGARRIIVAECIPTLSQWLESHPEKQTQRHIFFQL